MRIYIAARFETRESLRPVREHLWAMGHDVVSSWLDEVKKPAVMDTPTFFRKLAVKDLGEIRSADALVLDTTVPSDRGGKEVEFGYAIGLAQDLLVYIVGPALNVFHQLADRQFDTWDDFYLHVGEVGEVS